ncbi:MAG: transposase [Actinomycetia bacterium]|nr:transposase [Actinomycetes bacterium]
MFRILYRFLASLARLGVRSGCSKDLEIIVLRHQLSVLRRQVGRPAIADGDRTLLGAIAAALPRPLRHGWLVTPETLLRWRRRRIARHWTQPPQQPRRGRPATSRELRELIVRLAHENPTWGHRRIQGELARLGHKIAKTTVWQILTDNNIDPSPNRSEVSWTEFLHSQAAVACDFFTVDTPFLRRYYALFFIKVATREVFFAGVTANPTGAWATQAARNLFITHSERLQDARALVRDRGSQFIDSFDEIFRTEGMKILKAPARTPVANTFAERWIGSIRRELLKQPNGLPRTIIWNRHQLERLVIDYIAHHNQHRPHQSLDQRPPTPIDKPPDTPPATVTVLRTSRCDGLIHEYRNAA